MFTNDITLAGTSTSKTYALVSVVDASSVRRDATAAPGEPRSLQIKHQQVSRSSGVVDRHLIRLDDVCPGSSPDPDVTASVQLVIEMPRQTATVAQIKDIIARLSSFLASAGYVDKILNGEP